MDQRGWVLVCASGAACGILPHFLSAIYTNITAVLGSSIICLDAFLRRLPFRRFRNFSIRESSAFLAASLSLSFGVMFFSALYGMLPKAKEYLLTSGLTPTTANAILMIAFLGGVGGLQIVSELLHYCLPSSIVNCDEHGRVSTRGRGRGGDRDEGGGRRDERAPLLGRQVSVVSKISVSVSNLVRGCVGGAEGKCYGFSDHDCEQKCAGERVSVPGSSGSESPSHRDGEEVSINRDLERGYQSISHEAAPIHHEPHHHSHPHSHSEPRRSRSPASITIPLDGEVDSSAPGHHHVVDNQFLSIGVQTSIAIAIHKIPEVLPPLPLPPTFHTNIDERAL